MAVSFSAKYADGFICPADWDAMQPAVSQAHALLHGGSGAGSDFIGWLTLPHSFDKQEVSRIKAAAARIRDMADVLVVIGIGGSYLGARAVIEFLRGPSFNALRKGAPEILFAGNSLSADAMQDVLALCEGKRVCINVISKSGTTTEPAIAFRILRAYLEQQVGKQEAARRIFVTTDAARGTLKQLADEQGYETFVVPDDVGGRYSVLTPVGLLPIAAAGCDVDALLAGAAEAADTLQDPDINNNPCYRYAAARNILLGKGRAIELMAAYEPRFAMMSEWWKQLYGESEGKDGKGLFPASVIFSTDLHSLGQFVQDGTNLLFETAVLLPSAGADITVQADADNGDGLNFLAGQTLTCINRKAFEGTVLSHADGGTPTLVLSVPQVNEHELGYLIFFFEKACAISGYILGVNPFDQPGVEGYKQNMFALLGKPGFEHRRAALEARL